MLDDQVRELASGPNFAAFTTLLPSGRFATHIMWVGCDEDHLLINTEVHRQKFKNVSRDPRVTVTIWEAERPVRYAEARGRVIDTITGPRARQHIDELAKKYSGRPYPEQAIPSERVILVIEPERQRIWDVGRDVGRR
ncbi:MAG: pyridoxamine 5'-phosphate oxidase family protein [Acidimicrobiales bacterium]|nr:pyridoxamine 5'-phosphate oxidase family protein [Acidimicrobiales bacterium]